MKAPRRLGIIAWTAGQEASKLCVPSLCKANGRTPPTLAPRGHIHFWRKTNLHFLRPLLQLPERQASLAEAPTCLASLRLAAKAPAREETAAPQLHSCGNPGLPQLPHDKPTPKPGISSQSSNFIYKISQSDLNNEETMAPSVPG